MSRSQQVEGCGAKPNTEVEKFEQGCYSLFKAKFIDNIAIVGGDIDHNVIDLTSWILLAVIAQLYEILHFSTKHFRSCIGCGCHRVGHRPLCLLPWQEVLIRVSYVLLPQESPMRTFFRPHLVSFRSWIHPPLGPHCVACGSSAFAIITTNVLFGCVNS